MSCYIALLLLLFRYLYCCPIRLCESTWFLFCASCCWNQLMLFLSYIFCPLQVMLDFQAAERQRLEEPASDVGLESLCALVHCFLLLDLDEMWISYFSLMLIIWSLYCVWVQINNNLRCYELSSELSSSTLEALPQNYAEQVQICYRALALY